jgi:hypothetical protein
MGILLKISDKVHVHQCCKCGDIEQCMLGEFCDGPATNDFCLACANKQIADMLPCPNCGASEGYGVIRCVVNRDGQRIENIGLRCNVCKYVYEVEESCRDSLN